MSLRLHCNNGRARNESNAFCVRKWNDFCQPTLSGKCWWHHIGVVNTEVVCEERSDRRRKRSQNGRGFATETRDLCQFRYISHSRQRQNPMALCLYVSLMISEWKDGADEETQSCSTWRWGDCRILCYGHSGALLDSTHLQEERNWPSLLLVYAAPILESLSSLPIFFPSWLKCLTSMSRFCNNQIPKPNYSGKLTRRVLSPFYLLLDLLRQNNPSSSNSDVQS